MYLFSYGDVYYIFHSLTRCSLFILQIAFSMKRVLKEYFIFEACSVNITLYLDYKISISYTAALFHVASTQLYNILTKACFTLYANLLGAYLFTQSFHSHNISHT